MESFIFGVHFPYDLGLDFLLNPFLGFLDFTPVEVLCYKIKPCQVLTRLGNPSSKYDLK